MDEFFNTIAAQSKLPESVAQQLTDAGYVVIEGPVAPNKSAQFAAACGPAGSIIIYNGSVWHGWTANRSAQPRRSIQGAFIRREAQSGVELHARMRPETLARIGPLAKYLLDT